jgi:signal transduction histidine kinase
MTILVTNAMTHAFKAEQPGEILLLGQIEPDNSVSISCIDNGLGVPPDIVNRIFDMFFTTRGGAGGVGLGLHIAQNLAVQMFHGTLTCKSTLGKGSQFILHFPGTGLRSSTTTDLPSQPSGAKPDQTKGGG